MRFRIFCHVCCLLALTSLAAPEHREGAYREEIQKWRDAYEASLKRDNSWLALAGLFWLKEGENSFGTGSGKSIVLPAGSAPETAGTFVFHQGTTRLAPSQGAQILLNGKPVGSEAPLKPESSGKPDRITLGRLSMIVIHRGERYGIRLWDNENPARRDFRGTQWFPVKESYRVTAEFTAYPRPKMVPILNILGDTEPAPSPGFASFELAGKHCRMEPVLEEDQLFFVFKDATSGKQTYPAGRFLYAGLPKDGKVALDFNKAQNPLCAFTPYATCPLPPEQNYLPVAVEAGELNHDRTKN